MFDETNKYKNQGHFFFEKGAQLDSFTQKLPKNPGVFYVLRLAGGRIDLVYIGKSNKLIRKKKLNLQTLAENILKDEKNEKRQLYFEKKITDENIEALDIYWFATMDETHGDLPDYVHGLLMQRYFEMYGQLPPWNMEEYKTL